MTLALFASILSLIVAAVDLHASRKMYRRGYEAGITVALAVFRSRLDAETYRSICLARVAELDSVLGVRAGKDGAN